MDNFNQVFFSITAQVSATFMGFALLVPAIKTLSSGLFTGGRKYIKPHVLVKKFFFFISFPLFILANSLIISITILQNSSLPMCIEWFVFISALFFPFWLCWLQKNSKFLEHRIVYFMLEIPPWIFFIAHLVFVFLFLIYGPWLQSFWLFLKWDTLLLVLLGFVLILRNLMISPENGIFFTTKKDIKEELNNLQNTDWFSNDNESSSIDVQGEEEISSTIKKVADAIKKREELINLLKEWLSSSTSEIQIKLAIAGSNAEIENIKAYLGDIRHRLKSNILNKSTLTLSACADIEKRLGEAEVHLWEFQQGTARLEKIIKVFYIGEESS